MLHPLLTDHDYLKKLLARVKHQPARRAGQNFLVASEVVEAIEAAVSAGPPAVTELGAGVGPVTLMLLAHSYQVRAIERDTSLAGILRDHVPKKQQSQLTLVTEDLKVVDWSWPVSYQIVGNIPYNLSGFIIRRLTQLAPAPVQVILLVQQEVGQRLAAAPPDFHLVSLAVQLWALVTPLLNVPASCFWPTPKVASQLVLLTPHEDALPLPTREAILALAKPLFQQRRKQLRRTLAQTLKLAPEQAETLLQAAGVPGTARPQEVSLTQWEALYGAYRNFQ